MFQLRPNIPNSLWLKMYKPHILVVLNHVFYKFTSKEMLKDQTRNFRKAFLEHVLTHIFPWRIDLIFPWFSVI